MATFEPYQKMRNKVASAFPNATDHQWTKLADGFSVSFLNNGQKTRACYSEKGNLNYLVKTCNLSQLPEVLSNRISKKYAGYTLFSATEIQAYNTVAHQAVLENASGYVVLKATTEGVEEVQKLNKTDK
jgi:hypothetical protein